MRFIGDWGRGDDCTSTEDELCSNSMSAIVRLFTPEGFVVASDGRMLAAATDEIGSDEVQKIFPLRCVGSSSSVIGSIAGIAQLSLDDGTPFDFRTVLSVAAMAVEQRPVNDLHSYAGLIVSQIDPLIGNFRSISIPGSKDAAGTSIFLDCLFPMKMPAQETITITYGLTEVRISHEFSPIQTKRAYCSKKIWALLFDEDVSIPGWISHYRNVCHGRKMSTLADAIDVAVALITAHSEPEAVAIDPEGCRTIGGRIQIATLTLTRGFEWVSGFEPKNNH